jgi:iron-sulfur cluster assembly accessory protein
MITDLKSSNATQPIVFTETAITEIKKLLAKEVANKPLRIGVKNGGCAGFSYIFEFEDATDKDVVFDVSGITVVVDSEHLQYIQNLEINFEQGLNNRGFTFTNPNAQSTCGCGTSFA